MELNDMPYEEIEKIVKDTAARLKEFVDDNEILLEHDDNFVLLFVYHKNNVKNTRKLLEVLFDLESLDD